MSVSNLFKPGGLAWHPDANNINAPDGVLLRADNMVPDENGALTVRRGSRELLYTTALTEDVHSLHTVELRDGYTYRMMGMDDTLYVDPQPGNHTAIWERQFGSTEEYVTNGEFTSNATGWTLRDGLGMGVWRSSGMAPSPFFFVISDLPIYFCYRTSFDHHRWGEENPGDRIFTRGTLG